MRPFLRKIAIYLALMIGVSLFSIMLPDYANEDNMLYGLLDKHKRLAEIPAPRLILVGGSNLLFGINSEEIEKATGMPVVNMGMHAGAGLRFMINHAEALAEKGDVIIIAPEYAHFYDKSPAVYDGQDELLTLVLDVDPTSLSDVPVSHMLSLYRYMPNYIGNKYFGFFRYMFSKKVRKKKFVVYERDKLNRWGDVTGHLNWENIPFPPTPAEEYEVDQRVIDRLDAFHASMKERGVTTALIPTCYQQSSYDNTEKTVQAIEGAWSQMNMPSLAPAQRYVMADQYFWDSPEHLNREGREIRTQMLIEDLRPLIGGR